ncbi:hypothetical protein NG895_17810 [Aeoliella sp. ICT_H6.2]|uniref:Uncharacterized protein n=1 Tax=Aeoliella straminimaris TaxID=2954799 RepID=A0A9X2FCW9_9BACT|nr:hypothetical protein [Aeoliella straminimaris]MCO6045757.1 hypothetical protein [Aeoliella straminimaris]
MEQRLQEFVDSTGQSIRVDAERGVLRGVKLLGLASKNGRTYREAALASAIPLYEGAKVNVNHPKGSPIAPRDYQDRLGVVREVKHRPGEGLFGDLHFNPKHALAEQLAWDAQHAPEQVGLSHNVLARTKREGDTTVVEAITRVESVDLVADPATTRGLFEHTAANAQLLESLTVERLSSERADLVEAIERPLVEQLALLKRRVRIAELLAEHNLPLPGARHAERVTTPAFLDTLISAASEEVLETLVADRAALARSATGGYRPIVAREQQWLAGEPRRPAETAEQFAASLRR